MLIMVILAELLHLKHRRLVGGMHWTQQSRRILRKDAILPRFSPVHLHCQKGFMHLDKTQNQNRFGVRIILSIAFALLYDKRGRSFLLVRFGLVA